MLINQERTIWKLDLSRLESLVSKLNRKATKLGLEPLVLTVGAESQIECFVRDEHGRKSDPFWAETIDITLNGEYPALGGWQFVAATDHTSDGNILRKNRWVSEEIEIPVRYRHSAELCEHCNSRRRRKATYLVTSESGEWKQVGSTCLKSFLGGREVDNLLSYITATEELFASFDEAGEEGPQRLSSGPAMVKVEEFLAMTCAALRVYGWTARSGEGYATADRVWTRLFASKKRRDADLFVTDEDTAQAELVREWIAELANRDDLSDFEWNMALVGSREAVTSKHIGILAYSTVALQRVGQERKEAEKVAEGPQSEHVGGVGDKVKKVELEIVSTGTGHEGYYGINFPNVLSDEDGNLFQWWTGRDLEREFEKGTKLFVTSFTIKGHSEFKGRKFTDVKGLRFRTPE